MKIIVALFDRFSALLDVSLTASIVIVCVLIVRLLLKKAPKVFSYALWGIVLLRLLVPVSIASPVGIIPRQPEAAVIAEVNQALPEMELQAPRDQFTNQWYSENTPVQQPAVHVSTVLDPQMHLAFGWIGGMAVMLIHSLVSYRKLRKKVQVAVPLQKGIYLADEIATPFVMGIFRPTIFLPGTLEAGERDYIIAHERHHIRRGDHIFKALGFLALTVHWFNPLVWVAFVLAGRDMEMSCDEAVIRKLGGDIRADYAASLLNLATGHRLFSITPLAFGEGNPTGRVRNLAKWKKPALWVTVICVVLCALLAVCLLTDRAVSPEAETPPTEAAPTVPATTRPPETLAAEDEPVLFDWPSLKADDVSRTGATALFVYAGNSAFSYGDFLSLEQWSGEDWIPAKEADGYEYYVGDSSYPVMEGYGMVHEWSDRFGQLPDGLYRLGKNVTHDGTGQERMLYDEFSIPESIRTEPLSLEELPEKYASEEAMLDGCFVQRDGIAVDNKEIFQEFASRAQYGEAGFIRIVDWYYDETPACFVHDLTFDGTQYTLAWLENGKRMEKQYRYLKHFSGRSEVENSTYDAYEYYVLVNDDTITWEQIWNGLISSQLDAAVEHHIVYAELIKHPVLVQLPQNPTQAVLEFEGKAHITVTDAAQLENLYNLFNGADVLGYEPKTHSTGLQLHLVMSFAGGETVTIDLDPERDICKIGEEFVFYGAFDEPDYIEKLWQLLNITKWPDPVYEKYPPLSEHLKALQDAQ